MSSSAGATAASKKRKPNNRAAAGGAGSSNTARGSKKGGAAAASSSSPASTKTAGDKKASSPASALAAGSDVPPSTGFLIKCDIPTKMFIQNLDDLKTVDKKFILQNLDAYHLLVKHSAKEEIERKVEEWMDENVYSAVEKVGEDLDMS